MVHPQSMFVVDLEWQVIAQQTLIPMVDSSQLTFFRLIYRHIPVEKNINRVGVPGSTIGVKRKEHTPNKLVSDYIFIFL